MLGESPSLALNMQKEIVRNEVTAILTLDHSLNVSYDQSRITGWTYGDGHASCPVET